MDSKKFMSTLIIAVPLLVGGLWVRNATQPDIVTEPDIQQMVETTQKPQITFSDDKKTVSYEGQTSKTALEVLQAGTDVTTQDSSVGEFVTAINGLQAKDGEEYWSFYVDDEYATEGAGTYQTKEGEIIKWMLEAIQ